MDASLKYAWHSTQEEQAVEKQVEEIEEEEEQAVEKEEEEESDNKSSGDFRRYLKLYEAAQRGDWDTLKNFFKDHLSSTIISHYSETALHVAVVTGKANSVVDKLVKMMSPEELEIKNNLGNTALHNAAIFGNTAAAIALVERLPNLLLMPGHQNLLPVEQAALYGQPKTLEYLISQHQASYFEGEYGIQLLNVLIACDITDIAFDLVRKYPKLALLRDRCNDSPLSLLARKRNVFLSTETFSWWQTFIYRRISSKKSTSEADAAHTTCDALDIESLSCNGNSTSFQIIPGVGQKLKLMIWNAIENIVPKVKELRKKKAIHQQARQLVEYLCNKIASRPKEEASKIFESSIMMAAGHGISEVVEVILHTFPSVINHDDHKKTARHILVFAVSNRFENVFNIINSMSNLKYMLSSTHDDSNNLLHICGKLPPPHRLNLVAAGAALQMQRELQWFKEMENFVHPFCRRSENKDGKTPQMLFTEEHVKLKADGERWMKDTAEAYTIAAALISTVVFAAAFTVPGGNESATGIPLLSGKPAFSLFAVSNAVSFFTSITSLLMFLSILTSRYAEQDFLYSLPKRLAICLLSLFLSIIFMLLAFSAALCLLFQRGIVWFGVVVAALACLPVTSFVMLQFPLLVDVIYSAYGPGIRLGFN